MPKGVYPRTPRERKAYAPELVSRIRALYLGGMTQAEVAAETGLTQKIIFNLMHRHGIAARVAAKRDQFGERNHQWKGEEAGYQAMHRRLYARFGRPDHCSVCGTTEANAFDYANLTGNYADPEDYAPMCRSCHWKHDGKVANLQKRKEGCHV